MVDDEPKLRELIRLYLERDGYSVVEADSGHAALAIVARDVLDLVILDLGLPDVPGEDVLRVLAREEVPVVILTARATEPDRVAGLRAGADDYLVKPFSPRELVARVEAVLRRSHSLPEPTGGSYGDGALTLDDDRREVTVGARRSLADPQRVRSLGGPGQPPGAGVVTAGVAGTVAGQGLRGLRANC
ncbi:MAG: response regulator transcription factor [Geodermatophilaceae bacterium]